MSMMMPPDPSQAQGLPIAPGGADTPVPPMDAMSGSPLPADGGLEGLMAALGGAGGMDPGMDPSMAGPEGAPPEEGGEEMGPIEHIREAMKHLMMAMASENDDERGHGITKGMSALQGILGGEQKRLGQQAGM